MYLFCLAICIPYVWGEINKNIKRKKRRNKKHLF